MLASLLFPYDDDAPMLMDSWLKELEGEKCVVRYQADGQSYLEVCNWLNHQKIDKPSQSKFPSFESVRESSRILANPPRRKGREGKGKEGNGSVTPAEAVATIPDDEELTAEQKVWNAYVTAYANRYGVGPVDNAKVRSQIKSFCTRVSQDDAPHIAAYYVGLNKAFYVSTGHAIGPMLQDAESLRTSWVTGRSVTQTQAMQADKTAARGNVFGKLIEEAEANERIAA